MKSTQTPEYYNGVILLTPEQLKHLLNDVLIQNQKTPTPIKEESLDDIYLTNKEVQRLLNISHVTVFDWINKGKLKPVRIGRKLLFKKADLIK